MVPNKFSKKRNYHSKKHIPEVNDFTREEAIYLAGLIDADGSLGIYKQKYGYTTVVAIHNTSEKLIKWLKRTVGDMSVTKTKKNSGSFNCERTKPHYHFAVYAKVDVKTFLEKVKRFLIVKKREAEIMLEYLHNNIRGEEAIKLMNKEKANRKESKGGKKREKKKNSLLTFI